MSLRQTLAAKPWIVALGIIGLITLWMLSGNNEPPAPTNAGGVESPDDFTAPELRLVQVSVQEAEPIVRYINVYGRTAPARDVDIKAETNGRVEEIGIRRGKMAAEGDLIVRLDLRDRQARLAQARASVEEFQTTYDAQLELQNEGYVSETELAQIIAKLEGAKTELLRAELDLEYSEIRAPYDGALATRDVEIGDFVRAGDIIGNYIDNTSLIVSASLAEQDGQYVSIGDSGRAQLVTGQDVAGTIRFVSPVADVSTRTFVVELEIPNPDGDIPAGVTAEIRITGEPVMAHKVSPSLLNLETDGSLGIKTVDANNRVVFNPVEIARSETNGIWITGLPKLARIITVGQGFVVAGQAVTPSETMETTAVAAGTPK